MTHSPRDGTGEPVVAEVCWRHADQAPDRPFRYCGRSCTEAEVELIRGIIDAPRQSTCKDIARAVCAALQWVKPDGLPKLLVS